MVYVTLAENKSIVISAGSIEIIHAYAIAPWEDHLCVIIEQGQEKGEWSHSPFAGYM